jgi:D-sedoheptulose 7-phosphate isomerase
MRDSFRDLHSALDFLQCEDDAFAKVKNLINQNGFAKARLFFVGNGGSAAIASHMATDFMKNGEYPTFSFNDASLLTCITNDLGYENSFWLPIEQHGQIGDVLFAISSSGRSKNILCAVNAARGKRMNVITLSGFRQDNPLRGQGQVNFYVPSNAYGTVEICHLAILHSILDEVMTDESR